MTRDSPPACQPASEREPERQQPDDPLLRQHFQVKIVRPWSHGVGKRARAVPQQWSLQEHPPRRRPEKDSAGDALIVPRVTKLAQQSKIQGSVHKQQACDRRKPADQSEPGSNKRGSTSHRADQRQHRRAASKKTNGAYGQPNRKNRQNRTLTPRCAKRQNRGDRA